VGRASSSKKVARAAKTGGKTKVRTPRGTVFPIALTTVVVLGLALVVWARADRQSSVDTTAPQAGIDHWHAAYGFYICDKFIENIPDNGKDPLGVHTHGDGVMHIHPTSSKTSGRNAKVGRFFDNMDITMTNTKLTLPNKLGTWSNGDKCGDKPGKLMASVWDPRTATAKIYNSNFNDIRFTNPLSVFTFAFVPDGVTLPRPPSESVLDNLTDVNPATTTTVAGQTTVPGATIAPGVTTAPTTVANATTVAPTTTG
jgi:hypothetical protein